MSKKQPRWALRQCDFGSPPDLYSFRAGIHYMRPSISIIIPTFRNLTGLKKCLSALSEQTYPSALFEAIVVDNSPDNALRNHIAAFQEFSERSLQLKMVWEQKSGSYAARNKGAELSTGTVLAFTDDDCVPQTTWLAGAMRCLHAESCSLVGGKVLVTANDGPGGPVQWYDQFFAFDQHTNIRKNGVSVTANLFVNRTVFEQIQGFDSDLLSGGDADFCRRARESGSSIYYCAGAVVEHPARNRLKSLITKQRRVIGGLLRSNRRLLFSKLTVSPIVRSIRLLRTKSMRGRKCIPIIGIVWLLYAVSVLEFIRLLIGFDAERM